MVKLLWPSWISGDAISCLLDSRASLLTFPRFTRTETRQIPTNVWKNDITYFGKSRKYRDKWRILPRNRKGDKFFLRSLTYSSLKKRSESAFDIRMFTNPENRWTTAETIILTLRIKQQLKQIEACQFIQKFARHSNFQTRDRQSDKFNRIVQVKRWIYKRSWDRLTLGLETANTWSRDRGSREWKYEWRSSLVFFAMVIRCFHSTYVDYNSFVSITWRFEKLLEQNRRELKHVASVGIGKSRFEKWKMKIP